MTYSTGNTITAADLNGFVTTVNSYLGTGTGDKGYGQSTVASVSGTIQASEINAILAAVHKADKHQGGSAVLPNMDSVTQSTGDRADAFDGVVPAAGTWSIDGLTALNNLSAAVTSTNANYLDVDVAQQTTSGTTLTADRGTSWGVEIAQELDFTFADEDTGRAFFNSGGQIILLYTNPIGTAHDNDWNTVLSARVGTITFGVSSTNRSGDAGTPSTTVGHSDLTGTYATIYTGTTIGASPYTANSVLVEAKFTTGSNNVVRIKCTLTDDYTGFDDVVAAGANTTWSTRKSSLYTTTAPTVSEFETWSSGGS